MTAQNPDIDPLKSLLEKDGTDSKDQVIADLEGQNEQSSNLRYEERFIWFVVCLVLFDVIVFMHMENSTGPLVIGILELVGLVVMADRCKVDVVMPLIDRVSGALRKNTTD